MNEKIINSLLNSSDILAMRYKFGNEVEPIFYRIYGRSITRELYSFSSTNAQSLTSWTEPAESSKEILRPKENEYNLVYDIFWGISPSNVKVWTKVNGLILGDLRDTVSPSTSETAGYVRGLESPRDNISEATNIVTVPKLEVLFNVLNENPSGGSAITPKMDFIVGMYVVDVIKDAEMIQSLRLGGNIKPDKIVTVGNIKKPTSPSNHIQSIYETYYQRIYNGGVMNVR